jgi:hypothetical protein
MCFFINFSDILCKRAKLADIDSMSGYICVREENCPITRMWLNPLKDTVNLFTSHCSGTD